MHGRCSEGIFSPGLIRVLDIGPKSNTPAASVKLLPCCEKLEGRNHEKNAEDASAGGACDV